MEIEKNSCCRLCGSSNLDKQFSAMILNKYDADFYVCRECFLLQPSKPERWLQEAYIESINLSDTGILARNYSLARKTIIILSLLLGPAAARNGKFLDYGGGYGIFVRLMRDIGLDFYWKDEYSSNLVARGFEDQFGWYDAAVSFEVFEHLAKPLEDIEIMLQKTDTIVFSTDLYGSSPPQPDQWHYYGLTHGQHISFYSVKTLEWIAQRYTLNLFTDGKSFHILSRRKSSFPIILLSRVLVKINFAYILKRFYFKSKVMDDHYSMKKKEQNNLVSSCDERISKAI